MVGYLNDIALYVELCKLVTLLVETRGGRTPCPKASLAKCTTSLASNLFTYLFDWLLAQYSNNATDNNSVVPIDIGTTIPQIIWHSS